eukprot:1193122-Prorocentrum_minimum.AAC.2
MGDAAGSAEPLFPTGLRDVGDGGDSPVLAVVPFDSRVLELECGQASTSPISSRGAGRGRFGAFAGFGHRRPSARQTPPARNEPSTYRRHWARASRFDPLPTPPSLGWATVGATLRPIRTAYPSFPPPESLSGEGRCAPSWVSRASASIRAPVCKQLIDDTHPLRPATGRVQREAFNKRDLPNQSKSGFACQWVTQNPGCIDCPANTHAFTGHAISNIESYAQALSMGQRLSFHLLFCLFVWDTDCTQRLRVFMYSVCPPLANKSSIAQLVERAAVNRKVVGSNPAGGVLTAPQDPLFLHGYINIYFNPRITFDHFLHDRGARENKFSF